MADKEKSTEQTNPHYFTTHQTKEGQARYSHTYKSYADAWLWLQWIFKLPELYDWIDNHEKRIQALEAIHGSPQPYNPKPQKPEGS